MDLVISLAELSPKTAAFAAVAGPIKEALFPKPDLKDISKQLDKMSREIKNKVENEHRHTRIEIARQAEYQKIHMDSKFDKMGIQIELSNDRLYREIIELNPYIVTLQVQTTSWLVFDYIHFELLIQYSDTVR